MILLQRKPLGVSWYAVTGKWKAEVRFERVLYYLGYYETQEEAVDVVTLFRREHEMPTRELLGEPFISQLHPTKNGSEMTWPWSGSYQKVWWLCGQCGNEWQARIHHRTGPARSGCPKCAQRRNTNKQRMPIHIARAVALALDIEPRIDYPGSANLPWPCRCLCCGSIIFPTYGQLQQGKRACPTCWDVNRRIPLDKVMADLLACGFEVVGQYNRSDRRVQCLHLACQQVVWIRYNSVMNRGGGCPHCAKTGYDPIRLGHLYIIEFPAYDALKLGISNDLSKRLAVHQRHGWRIDDALTFGPFPGVIPPLVERAVIQRCRLSGYNPVEGLRDTDGFRETFSIYNISHLELRVLVDQEVAQQVRLHALAS